jgi:AcrR family transcriptional regulator
MTEGDPTAQDAAAHAASPHSTVGLTLTWTKARGTRRGPAPDLTQIVRAAVAIADADGIEAVSMRRIAAALRSGTASLYRCIDGREELLDLMVDAVLGDDPHLPASADWRTDLTAFARQLRVLLRRHPWLAPQMAGRPTLGPHALAHHEFALTAAASLTADATSAVGVVDTVMAYVLGATAREMAEAETQRRTGMTEQQWRALVGPYVQQIVRSGRYPQLARAVREAEDLDHEQRFASGLACVLDGIAARRADQGRA